MDEDKDVLVDSISLEIRKQESFITLSQTCGTISHEDQIVDYSMEIAGRMLMASSGKHRLYIDLVPAIKKMAGMIMEEERKEKEGT